MHGTETSAAVVDSACTDHKENAGVRALAAADMCDAAWRVGKTVLTVPTRDRNMQFNFLLLRGDYVTALLCARRVKKGT